MVNDEGRPGLDTAARFSSRAPLPPATWLLGGALEGDWAAGADWLLGAGSVIGWGPGLGR